MPSVESSQYVTSLYAGVLFRDPDPYAQTWGNMLDDGSLTQSQLLNIFLDSNEAQADVAPIVRLYQAAFKRTPDAAGLKYWVSSIKDGSASLLQIAKGFVDSAEFASTYGSATPDYTSFLTALYQNALGRPADNTGLQYWLGQLQGKVLSVAEVLASFFQSPEDVSSSASATRTYLTDNFNAIVTPGNPQSPDNPAPPVTRFELTTTVDALAATAANSTFHGIVSTTPANSTLNAGDSMTGVGTGNVLNIEDQAGTGLPAFTTSNVQTINIQSVGGVTLDTTTGISGLTQLNISASTGTDNLTVGNTTALSVTDSGGDVTTHGGSSVTVSTDATHMITVNAGSMTTSVTLSGGQNDVVSGLDQANAQVTLSGSTVTHLQQLTGTAASLTLTHSGTTADSIDAITDAALTSLSVNQLPSAGSFNLGTSALDNLATLNMTGDTSAHITTRVSSGVTLNGASNNANVSFTSQGATAAGKTDSIALGNGDNTILLRASGTPGVTESGVVTWGELFSTAPATETIDVTWQDFIIPVAGSETIGGLTVTSDGSSAFTAAQVAAVAEGAIIAGLSITSAADGWTVSAGSVAGDSIFTSTTSNAVVATPSDSSSAGSGGSPTFIETVAGTAGQTGSESIGGMTISGTGGHYTANQVATVAAGGTVTGLTITTNPTGWFVSNASGASTTFTSSTPNADVADPTAGSGTNGSSIPGYVKTQDGAAVQASGGLAGSTHNVTLGDGNNTITDYSVGTTHITAGAGSNTITTAAGVTGTIDLGAHTTGTADQISVGASGSGNAIVTISGLNNNGTDTITFSDAASEAARGIRIVYAPDVVLAGGSDISFADWLSTAVGRNGLIAQQAHGIVAFQFGGDTYLVETAAATDSGNLAAQDTVIHLTGAYTFSNSTATAGVLHLLG